MSKSNLHTLLSHPLYIEPGFGLSCVPALYDVLKNTNQTDKPIEPKITVHKMDVSESSVSTTAKSVVVLTLNQPIIKYSTYYWLGTASIITVLDSYKNDESILGVVMHIDSGGGQAHGTPILYDYIKQFKQTKPLVVYTDGFLCSAAYYLAAPASKIIANKRAEAIGSIGAYATIVDFDGVLEHFGAKIHTMYADESTEKNESYREVLKGNYEPYIKNELNPLVAQFWDDMIAERPQINEAAKHGKTFMGDEALLMGLVDEVGTLETAIQTVVDLSNVNINSKPNTMSKERLKIQGVLGLGSPLAVNDSGSYLNDEQLDTIELAIESRDSEVATLKADLQKAQENTELNEKLNSTSKSLSDAENSINEMLTASGLPVQGTLTEKLTALNSKVVEMSGKPGANPTQPPISTGEAVPFAIDTNAEHNKLANSINKK